MKKNDLNLEQVQSLAEKNEKKRDGGSTKGGSTNKTTRRGFLKLEVGSIAKSMLFMITLVRSINCYYLGTKEFGKAVLLKTRLTTSFSKLLMVLLRLSP